MPVCNTFKMPNVFAMPRNLNSLCIIFCCFVFFCCGCGCCCRCHCCCCVALFPYGILYLPRKLIVISWLCRYSYNCCISKHFSAAIVIIVFDYYEDFRYLGFWLFRLGSCIVSFLHHLVVAVAVAVWFVLLIHNNITCFESINYKFFAELARRFVFPSEKCTPHRQHTSCMHDLPQFRCTNSN